MDCNTLHFQQGGKKMNENKELLKNYDRSDMAGWTRKFVDDVESAFQRDLSLIHISEPTRPY